MREEDIGEKTGRTDPDRKNRTIRDLVNTPFKKSMFAVQMLSWLLIPGSPVIGAAIGRALDLSKGGTAGVILAVFILGEVLFYASLAFLGKELLLILRDRFRLRFRRKRMENRSD